MEVHSGGVHYERFPLTTFQSLMTEILVNYTVLV